MSDIKTPVASTPVAPIKPEVKVEVKPVTPATTTLIPEVKPEVKPSKEAERQAAALARARRIEVQNREAQNKLEAERKAFQAERQAHAQALEKAKEFDRLSEVAKNDPLKLLEAAGITQQQVLDRMVKGDTRTPEEMAQALVDKRFAEYEAKAKTKAEEDAKAAQEARLKANEAAKQEALQTLDKTITDNPDKYEFCSTRPDAAALAYKVIEEYYKVTFEAGRAEILPFDEALDSVETDLEQKFIEFESKSKKLAAKKAAAEVKKAEVAIATSGTKNRLKPIFKDAGHKTVKPDVVDAQKAETDTDKNLNLPESSLLKARNRRGLAKQFDEMLAKKRDN